MSGIMLSMVGGAGGPPAGQQAYTSPGTYTWTAPLNVTSVSVVAVGGGEVGCNYGGGGGGGALGYVNNYTVVPGNSYTVVVGSGARNPCTAAGDSYFVSTAVVKGGAAVNNTCTPASYTGTGGGVGGIRGRNNACYAGYAGGGGAGGYSGAGGHGITYNATCGYAVLRTAGAGGGGGGGGGTCGYGGGGVGLLGQGANGSIAAAAGGGGSGGCNGGATYSNPGVGKYGGGSGGGSGGSQKGSIGGVRIIWPGNTRLFPSTCTGNL